MNVSAKGQLIRPRTKTAKYIRKQFAGPKAYV